MNTLDCSMQNNNLTSKGASLFIDALAEYNPTISILDFYANQVDDACMKSLGKYLKNNQYLEEIDIGNNQITDEGVEILSEYIIGNTKLKRLQLNENGDITDQSIPALIKIIESTHIVDLGINLCSIEKENALNVSHARNMLKYGSKSLSSLCM